MGVLAIATLPHGRGFPPADIVGYTLNISVGGRRVASLLVAFTVNRRTLRSPGRVVGDLVAGRPLNYVASRAAMVYGVVVAVGHTAAALASSSL